MDFRAMHCPTLSMVFWMGPTEGRQPSEGHLGWAVKKHLGYQRLPRGYRMNVIPEDVPCTELDHAGKFLGRHRPGEIREVITLPLESSKPHETTGGKVESAILELMQELQDASVSEALVREIVLDEIQKRTTDPIKLEIKTDGKPPVKIDGAHKALPTTLKLLSLGENVLAVGRSGSGKSYLARQASEALEVEFYHVPQCNMGYDILGFNNVGGYQTTPAREAYQNGGLLLLDEFDAWGENAALAANALLDGNGFATFPDSSKALARHDKCFIIAAANTWGHGADREYVGRNQLDAATLNRFIPVEIDYDRSIEQKLAGEYGDWLALCWKVRDQAASLKMRHVVSTRDIIRGAKLLADNMPEKKVRKLVLQRNLSDDDWRRISE